MTRTPGRRGVLSRVVSWGTWPALIGGALAATRAGLGAGWSAGVVVPAVVAAATVPLLVLQRVMPAEPRWRGQPRDFSVDLLHLATVAGFLELVRLGTLGSFYAAAERLSAAMGDPPWPQTWPWPAQLALALLLGEAGAYWAHRACHRVPFLWRLHAMHHSSERMYVLAAGRNHPLNALLMHACHVVPATLLGAPVEILALCGAFTGVHGMLQHCNVDLSHGPLNLVFATADLHRWHHAADRAASDTNFGNNLVVWDWVFGTRALPAGRPDAVGLGPDGLRTNWFAHLASPLRPPAA